MKQSIFRLIMALIISTSFSFGQNTTSVTGTVTDSDAQIWANGSWSWTLYNPSGGGNAVYTDGTSVPKHAGGSLDATGSLQAGAAIPNNAKILPTGTQANLTICSLTSAPNACQTFRFSISGTTYNLGTKLSTLISPPRQDAANLTYNYNTLEIVNPVQGTGYINTISNQCFLFQNGAYTSCGGGPGITPAGTLAFQASNSAGTNLQQGGMYTNTTFQNRYSLSTQPGISPVDGLYTSNADNCPIQKLTGYTGGSQNIRCRYAQITNSKPGYYFGSAYGFSILQNMYYYAVDKGANISQMLSGFHWHPGIGDTAKYTYLWSQGGFVGIGDEGHENNASQGGEQATLFTATVLTAPTSQSITVAVSDLYGQGRYLKNNSSTPILSNDFTTSSFTCTGTADIVCTIPVNGTIPSGDIATAVGTQELSTTPPINNIYPFTTSTTFVVDVTSGAYTTGGLICFGSMFHECEIITTATALSGGKQTLTVPTRKPHRAGGTIVQGIGTMALDWYANRVASNTLAFPNECLGATDSHTLICVNFSAGGSAAPSLGNVIPSSFLTVTRGMSNTGGVVSIPIFNAEPHILYFVDQPVITISGATPSQFNGQCTATHYDPTGKFILCNQAASTGLSTSVDGSLSLGDTGVGNSRYDLYLVAEVIDVENPVTGIDDGTLSLEPNQLNIAVGNSVTEQHGYSISVTAHHDNTFIQNPKAVNPGANYTELNGASQYSSQQYIDEDFAYTGGASHRVRNYGPNPVGGTPDVSNYIGGGGTQMPPFGYILDGIYRNRGVMTHAPFPSGTTLDWVGCPFTALGCNDPYYNYFSVIRTKNGRATWNYWTGGDASGGTNPTVYIDGMIHNFRGGILQSDGNKVASIASTTGGLITRGIVTLTAGSSGTISTPAAQAPSSTVTYQLTHCVSGGTMGNLTPGTIVGGVSFVITSDNAADTSQVCWTIIQ